jgi:hypothetical protein
MSQQNLPTETKSSKVDSAAVLAAQPVEPEATAPVTPPETAVARADNSQALAPMERSPLALLPGDADDMWRLSVQLAKASVVPEALRSRPNDVFIVLMTGSEMGLAPMQSLHSLDIVHGRVFVRARLRIAKVLQSGHAEYFRCEQSDDKSSRWRTRRKGWGGACGCSDADWAVERIGKTKCVACDREIVARSMALTFTLEMAKAYGLLEKKGSGYKSKPAVMLRWRAGGQLADAVYPEIVMGMVSEEDADAPIDGGIVESFDPETGEVPTTGTAGLKAALARS